MRRFVCSLGLVAACASTPAPTSSPPADEAEPDGQGLCGRLELVTMDGEDERIVCRLSTGGTVEFYDGTDLAMLEHVDRIASGMADAPSAAGVLADTRVIVGPPDASLDIVPELASLELPYDWTAIEGIALYYGLDGAGRDPTLAIRHDSVERWDLGVSHEILHLVLHDLGPQVQQEVWTLRQGMIEPGSPVDPNANHHELFCYFGQWMIAGHDAVLAEEEPELHAFLLDDLEDAQTSDRGTTRVSADAAQHSLLRWFRTGSF